jgi:hypothetical protein
MVAAKQIIVIKELDPFGLYALDKAVLGRGTALPVQINAY